MQLRHRYHHDDDDDDDDDDYDDDDSVDISDTVESTFGCI